MENLGSPTEILRLLVFLEMAENFLWNGALLARFVVETNENGFAGGLVLTVNTPNGIGEGEATGADVTAPNVDRNFVAQRNGLGIFDDIFFEDHAALHPIPVFPECINQKFHSPGFKKMQVGGVVDVAGHIAICKSDLERTGNHLSNFSKTELLLLNSGTIAFIC